MDTLNTAEYVLHKMSRWLVVCAVILSVWLLGSAEAWTYLIVCQILVVAMILWLMSLMAGVRPCITTPALTATLILLAVFVFLQSVSLPRAAVETLNPFAGRIILRAQSALSAVASQVVPDWTLSLCPAATRRSLFLLISYIGTFLIIVNTVKSWEQLRNIAVALVTSGFLLSLAGVIHKFSGSDKILWFHEPRYGGDIFGPFTNPNHFAAHVNMLIGAALGLYLGFSRLRAAVDSSNWADWVARYSTRRASAAALAVFAVTLMGGAVCMSLSRGGMTSLVAAVGIVLLAITSFSKMMSKTGFRLVVAVIFVIAAVIWLGWKPVVEELLTLGGIACNPTDDARFIATCDTLKIFGVCPVFGAGFGSFRHVFPVFESESLHFGRWLHAHNDWAQLLAEGGAVGATLFLVVIVQWVRVLKRRFLTVNAQFRLMVIGLIVGIIAVAIHSFWDYSLHKPCNMFLLATVAGLSVAAVSIGPDPVGKEQEIRVCFMSHVLMRFAGLLIVAGLAFMGILLNSEIRGELAYCRFTYLEKLAERTTNAEVLCKSVRRATVEIDRIIPLARGNPDVLREITTTTYTWMVNDKCDYSLRLKLAGKAHACAKQAVRSAPSDCLTWIWMGRIEASLDKWDEAETCLDMARSLVIPGQEVRLFRQK